ncbi:cytochrome c biogenesis protein ResB [Nocardioides sp. SOB77]|uniref:Cytochrome c biogenesis protein ResB n=1 Tax=Nocardioides oceani TaxID=3058369 RepID=A0ABT8FMB3_9ACTN|nr:cytochrome c biogenesis protein ResB [Nocardioides oceani]MDN4175816.1 cytochrome c biogenesis protein ResB [Nocardioides oceani]
MRTALVLLLLLAIAAVPGSLIPQTNVDPFAATRWKAQHPRLTPLYERLDLFAVYGSAWFSAVYLLLALSLVGCIGPRLRHYWRAARAEPPPMPRRFDRLAVHREFDTWPRSSDAALADIEALLSKRRFRVDRDERGLRAERGYLREAGNLLFHASLLLVLVGFGYGKLLGYTGGVILVQGTSFTNALSQYDQFVSGSLFDSSKDLKPFAMDLDRFEATYLPNGQPLDFEATVVLGSSETSTGQPTRPPAAGRSPRAEEATLRVNEPLTIDNTNIYLVGHGYAPSVTVKDGRGRIAYQGPTTFLPQDGSLTSVGVIKAPDARPTQLGFEGRFEVPPGP